MQALRLGGPVGRQSAPAAVRRVQRRGVSGHIIDRWEEGSSLVHRTIFVLVVLAAAGLGGLVPSVAAAAPAAGGYRAASPEYGLSVFAYGSPETTQRDL